MTEEKNPEIVYFQHFRPFCLPAVLDTGSAFGGTVVQDDKNAIPLVEYTGKMWKKSHRKVGLFRNGIQALVNLKMPRNILSSRDW